jgi:peptidoglycan/xylan/chitin deacetylase (PgdA/CDA1 family)
MGLDITAYRQIAKIDAVFDEGGDPIDPVTREALDCDFQAYLNPDFPGRADEITDRGVYTAEDSMRGWSGGYGRYNNWRDQLAQMAGYPATEHEQYGIIKWRHDAGAWAANSGPFWEMINFSDCEGVIGASVSAKLAKDFADFQGAVDLHEDECFREKYAEWREVFEMAADGGAVRFH